MSDKICTFVYHFKNKNMIYICRKSFQSIENGEGYYLGCEIDYEEFIEDGMKKSDSKKRAKEATKKNKIN